MKGREGQAKQATAYLVKAISASTAASAARKLQKEQSNEAAAAEAKDKAKAAAVEAHAKAEAAAAAANPVGYIRPLEAAALLDKEEAARLDKIAADKGEPAAPSGKRPAVNCPDGDVISFYDKILPAYSKLTEDQKVLLVGGKPKPALEDALDAGVTASVVEERLTDFVNCTSVTSPLLCCATCGRQPLPAIQASGGARRVDHGRLHEVSLADVAVMYPWVRLTRGRCVACAAGPDSGPCTCPFEQRGDKSLDVPWPPPEPAGDEHPQGAPRVYTEDEPHPQGDDHSGSDTGWYLGIPPKFRGAFPVSTDKPGFFVFVEPAYIIKGDAWGADQVPMCHVCYNTTGSKAPTNSYANFRQGDPTRCQAATAGLLLPLTFIESVLVAPIRSHNFLLVIKEQEEKGQVARVTGNTIAFPMVEGVGAGDFSHLGHLYNDPGRLKEFVRVLLLDPKGKGWG